MLAILCLMVATAQAPVSAETTSDVATRPRISSPEELAAVVFLRSLNARCKDDLAAARKHLPSTFTDGETAKLIGVSRDIATLFPKGAPADASAVMQIESALPLESDKQKSVRSASAAPPVREYLGARLGEDLYLKLTEHASGLIKMRSVPPPPRENAPKK